MFSWSDLFSDEVLKRGETYYSRISNVRRVDNKIFGIVEGSSPYFVCVTINEDTVKSVECNCYYDGHCKHEVALLNFIDEHEELLLGYDKLISKIYGMDTDSLRRVLLELAENEKYSDKLSNLICDSSVDKKKIKNKLNDILGYYEGGIITDILEFIDNDISQVFDSGDYNLACDLLNRIVEEYLFNYEEINYNSEDILTDRYFYYSKRLLDNDSLSIENKEKIRDYVDRICYP